MKKIISVVMILFLITGCNNKKEEDHYKHYSLESFGASYSKYNVYKDEYIVANTTKKGSELIVNGLLYNIKDNDYILLDEFATCGYTDAYKSQHTVYFYLDKLYVNVCHNVYEYTLNGTKTQKEDLLSKFDMSKINITNLYFSSITEIDDKYIYFDSYSTLENKSNVSVKCDKNTYICEIK